VCVVCECNAKDYASDGSGNCGGEKSGETMFGFSDTIVSSSGTLSNPIRDETTGKSTNSDSENGGNRDGARVAKSEEVGWLGEEDGELDTGRDDPSEEVAVDEGGPEDGRDGDKGEWSKENFGEVGDGVLGFLEFEDVAECHALAVVQVLGAGIDGVVGNGVEVLRRVYEMIASIVGLGKEEDCGDENDTGCDGANPPEPLDGELLADPTVDEGTKGRARSQEESVDGHLGSTFMKEEDYILDQLQARG